MPKTRETGKIGPSQCELSPNETSALIKRSVLTPKGMNVAGMQHEVPTPGGKNKAFHNVAPLGVTEVERKRLRAEHKQADRNSRKKAKSNTMTNNERGQVNDKRRALYQVTALRARLPGPVPLYGVFIKTRCWGKTLAA